ncbi:MAG TPA: TIGR01777 family oxidoreductase, partial [Kofleriaceae bacterium]|nr:TIGR01777 family oxidoreductase [Kofleriaceae bacterium]
VTGGTGTIGRALVSALRARGDEPIVVSRDAARARSVLGPDAPVVEGDPTCAGAWREAIAGCGAVVSLAGERIQPRRWNAQIRQILHDSRVDTTRNVVEAIAAAPAAQRPSVLVSASGIDYYALEPDLGEGALDDTDEVDESAPPGESFLSRLCRDWEAEAREAEALGVRVVTMRTGLVIGGEDSPIESWMRAFRWFAGGRVGSGRQWVSWIHLEDAVRAYLHAIDTPALSGPVNLVAPDRLRNRDFARALGRSLRRPSWLPAPAAAVRLALGDLADHILLGRPAVPRALLDSGFEFHRREPFPRP